MPSAVAARRRRLQPPAAPLAVCGYWQQTHVNATVAAPTPAGPRLLRRVREAIRAVPEAIRAVPMPAEPAAFLVGSVVILVLAFLLPSLCRRRP